MPRGRLTFGSRVHKSLKYDMDELDGWKISEFIGGTARPARYFGILDYETGNLFGESLRIT